MPLRKTYPHGYLRYAHNKCRCDVCRTDATRVRNREWYRFKHGEGPILIDGTRTIEEVRMLKRLGLSGRRIALRSGVSTPTVNRLVHGTYLTISSRTRDRIHLLWQDVFGEDGELYDPNHPARIRGGSAKRGPAIWPRAALKAKVLERDGELGELERMRLNNGATEMWSTHRADRIAIELGFLPWEVWDGWNDRSHAGDRTGGDLESVAGATENAGADR